MVAPQAFRNILYCSPPHPPITHMIILQHPPPHPPITHMNAWKGYCRRLHERSLKNNENEKGISLFVIPYFFRNLAFPESG